MAADLPFICYNPHLDIEPGVVREPFILNGVFPSPDGRWWVGFRMQFTGKDSPERLAIDPKLKLIKVVFAYDTLISAYFQRRSLGYHIQHGLVHAS